MWRATSCQPDLQEAKEESDSSLGQQEWGAARMGAQEVTQ